MLLQAKELAFRAVWQSTCYRDYGCQSQTGTDISDFGRTRRQRWPAMQEQACLSQSVRGRKQKITQHARKACRSGVPRCSFPRRKLKMKNRVFVALFVAVILALPVVAQQTSSTPQDQPAASQPMQAAPAAQTAPATPSTDQTSSTSSQTVGATGKQPLQAETHEGFWGKVNPFRPQEVCAAPDPAHPRPHQ